MRYFSAGFHLVMLALVIAAFAGVFAPATTGSFSRDAGGNANVVIGMITIWVIGAIVLRILRAFSKG